MQPPLTAAIDQVIEHFNARKLDLPDGFFDRRTQFVINGAPFETLLGQSPTDPLVLMLARGPAGFRFAAKALQHAIPDAKLERPSTRVVPATPDQLSLRTGGPSKVAFDLSLSGKLRETEEAVNTIAAITLTLAAAGHVEAAEAIVEESVLEKIRQARLRP
jgi:hypothetical protein